MANTQKTYALILGIVLLIVGIWGFFLPGGTGEILKLFGVNYLQSGLHVIAGIFGIYAGTKGEGKGYNSIIGWIALIVGILGLIPGVKETLMNFLSINMEISVLHIVIGIVSLGVYYMAKK